MKKLIKFAGILVGVVVTLVVAVIVIVTLLIDPNDYRDDITRLVKEKSGHDLAIHGDLVLSYFPWVGIDLNQIQLDGAPGFGADPMVKVDRVNIRVKLLPLLRKSVEMDTVVLNGAVLHLARDAKGKGNWEVSAPAPAKEATVKEEPTSDAGGVGLAGLDINGVELRDAHLVWQDQGSNTHIALENINLRTGHLQPGKQVQVSLDMDVKDKAEASPFHVSFTGNVNLDMEQQLLDVEQLKLAVADLVLEGKVKVTQLLKNPVVQAEITSNEFVPRDVAAAFAVTLPETQDPAVFGKAKLSLVLRQEPDLLDISSLMVQLDDTSIRGKVDVRNFSKPAIRFSVQLDEIDADRYLPPSPPEGAGNASTAKVNVSSTAGNGAAEAELLPVEMLRDLNVTGDLKIGKLKAANLSSQQIEVGLQARQGKIRVHPASALLYEGSYKGDIGIDVSGPVPRISMNEKLAGVQAEPLFLDVADLKWVTGRADMAAKLTTTGNTMSALRKGLNGEVEFSFLNGAIKGFNLMHAIRSANAMIQGFPAPAEEAQQTDFAELRGHANVRDGVVHNDLLVASSPLFKVTGKGSADLVREQLDYRVTTEITATLEGEAGRRLEKIKGTPLPVKISGSFYDPSIKVDLEDILKEKLKKKVEEKIEQKIQEKLDDKLKDQLGDKLKGLFGR